MPLQIRFGGNWITPSALKIFSGGAWRDIKAIKLFADGEWRDVGNFTTPAEEGGGGGGGTLVISVSNTTVNKSGTNQSILTGNVTTTPSGGLAPYTYAWAKLSGDSISAVSPASATTQFRATTMAELEVRTATFRVTCTDSLGSSDTEDVSVTITRTENIGS